MRTVLKRWWFWSAGVLLGLACVGMLTVLPSRDATDLAIFERIHENMSREDVIALFESKGEAIILDGQPSNYRTVEWNDGPNWIRVSFRIFLDLDGNIGISYAVWKDIHIATSWEAARWRWRQFVGRLGF